jgi:type VI secretion system protein ImpB
LIALTRARKKSPRVDGKITYDVEIGGAIELKELPFVVGVLGDLTGQPEQPLAEAERPQVRRGQSGQLRHRSRRHEAASVLLRGEQAQRGAGSPNLKVDLHFKSMDDFEPENVARQVKPLKSFWIFAPSWRTCAAALQGNDKLEELLLEAVGNTEKLDKLKGEMGKEEVQWLIHKNAAAPAAAGAGAEKGLLDQIVEEGRFGQEPASKERGQATWSRNSSPRSSMAR